jgi:type I restriction-modification system DNA methylase subunit
LSAPPEIAELVQKFDRRLNEYRSSCYNEEELRTEFVNPFFEALGWDVGNRQGLPGDAREVKLEEAIRVEESIRNPDFTFRVDGRRKFFVETKKPSINIEGGIYPAFQVRRYAWSAGLSLSILTDFEELAIYDCRAEPSKADKPAKARLMYLQYDQYVERWDEIAALFSREAVLGGSLDRFIESVPEKRGTKRVDAALLEEISDWREMLAKNIALRNSALSQKDLNFAVQRTIDRILFLRICEDRAIEEYGRLKALLEGEGVYARLLKLFEEADERYNSGIFHFREERDRKEPPDSLTLNLAVDDNVLKQIIKDLYFPDSPYVFSEIPAEILGQVYEQFLGKVIVLDEAHEAEVEYKPEVRKAGGVYYTPGYIVEYIVKNTVGKLLEDKTPQEASELRILDPACGSGSFLIGAYQYLLDWHKDWYVQNLVPLLEKGRSAASPEVSKLLPVSVEKREDRKARKIYARAAEASLPVFKANGNEWRLTTAERKRILLNNIYGVDIDPQAVEVTKLSLLLKVLEGETKESITSLLRYFRERALPDLGSNIKSGNSLIGWDILDDRPDLPKEELQKVNPFDWRAEFPEVFARGGFDAVIGNPPYIRIHKLVDYYPHEVSYIQEKFSSAKFGKVDIYAPFAEKGYDLMNDKGLLGFIIPNKFMQADYGIGLRSLIVDNRALNKIVDFCYAQVFENATIYTCLLFLSGMQQDVFLGTFNTSDSRPVDFLSKNSSQNSPNHQCTG